MKTESLKSRQPPAPDPAYGFCPRPGERLPGVERPSLAGLLNVRLREKPGQNAFDEDLRRVSRTSQAAGEP